MPGAGWGTLIALLLLIVVSVWVGTAAQRVVQKGSFIQGYFLGNRGLGAWTLALTATVQSGGTFMGFPSLAYSHGWAAALWIAGFMVVPIMGFGVLGKRLAQISRRTGAITIPDILRERFGSSKVSIVALIFVLFFMSFMMVAQFKAGALIMKLAWPGSGTLETSSTSDTGFDTYYYLGLMIFSTAVVGYTLIGGFLAAVWSDLVQSAMMLFGVLVLLLLTVPAAGGIEQATRVTAKRIGPEYVYGPGYVKPDVAGQRRQFLPLGLAFSYFFVWVFLTMGNPSGIVRLIACSDTRAIRRAILILNSYNTLIYIPLLVISICGRALIPDLPSGKSDEIIPRLALLTSSHLPGGSFLAGLILAAPFGAVMATVSGYLVVIASGLVRDLYQGFIHPLADDAEIRRLSHRAMIVIGTIAFVANLYPVDYLQAIVVFSGTGIAAAFVVPAVMTAYWRRATASGAVAAMIAGAGTVLVLYIVGWVSSWMGYDQMIGQATRFRPYYLLGLDPIVWGLLASCLFGISVSLNSNPPDPQRVSWLFDSIQKV
ncbi:MAG: sodium:solute symporter [Acidobacteria bacterium]|nr:sodium:solute symporter [Acidobacteriota bacterium]